jgi:hypothetical protein
MTKDKIYHLLNEKLFNIADLHYQNAGAEWRTVENKELWETYLKEMGMVLFVRSGWFKENDMEDEIENLSFSDLQGQKVDIEWIKENLIIIQDPLAQYHRVGIPKELAMSAMTLGYFPDSPSIQKMRERNE